jgi:hypothetical protein
MTVGGNMSVLKPPRVVCRKQKGLENLKKKWYFYDIFRNDLLNTYWHCIVLTWVAINHNDSNQNQEQSASEGPHFVYSCQPLCTA